MNPKFSVIIAVYNKERYLAETLQSVLNQTCKDFEVILVNDGSTDKSSEVIAPFLKDRRFKYFEQQNTGAGAARNKAIGLANYPYLALLDADDIWDLEYLSEMSRLIIENDDQAVFASGQRILEGGKFRDKHYAIEVTNGAYSLLNFFTASDSYAIIHSSSVVIAKRVLDKVGLYRPEIISGQDTDLWIRIGLEYPVVFLNKPLATYRLQKGSLFRSTSAMTQKFDPDTYSHLERDRPDLKKYLDLNRFALARQAKIWGEYQHYRRLRAGIDMNHLNVKQKFLLGLPRPLLSLSLWLKSQLQKLGLQLSAYK